MFLRGWMTAVFIRIRRVSDRLRVDQIRTGRPYRPCLRAMPEPLSDKDVHNYMTTPTTSPDLYGGASSPTIADSSVRASGRSVSRFLSRQPWPLVWYLGRSGGGVIETDLD